MVKENLSKIMVQLLKENLRTTLLKGLVKLRVKMELYMWVNGEKTYSTVRVRKPGSMAVYMMVTF